LVVQQHHVLVARIPLDVAIELADRGPPALDGLQEHAPAVAEDARDAAGDVVRPRLRDDGLDRVVAGIDGAAGVEKADEHGVQRLRGRRERNSRRRFGSLRNTPRITELILLLSIFLTPRHCRQRRSPSTASAIPSGWVFSWIRSASWTTASSWICGRHITHSARRA